MQGKIVVCSLLIVDLASNYGEALSLYPRKTQTNAWNKFPTLPTQSSSALQQHPKNGATTGLWSTSDDGIDEVEPEEVPSKYLLCSKSPTVQKVGVAAIFAAILAGTSRIVKAFNAVQAANPVRFDAWKQSWALAFGILWTLFGALHFSQAETFSSIVPPLGTWGGLWKVPAPGAERWGLSYSDYHTYWSGVCESGGGLLLLLSRFCLVPSFLPPRLPAALLGLLVLAVTPANIYVFTHNVEMKNAPPMPYPHGRLFRFGLQCLVLAMFWKLSMP